MGVPHHSRRSGIPECTSERPRRTRLSALAATLAAGSISACAAPPTSAGAQQTQTPTIAVAPAEVAYGSTVAVAGAGVPPAVPVQLEADPYPYRGWRLAATATSAADGSYAFAAYRPLRDERLRVVAASAASPEARVIVDPLAALRAVSLGPGRVRLSAQIRHAPGLASPPVSAWWYLASAGSDVYRLAAVTSTSELPGAVTYASATVDPPSARFRYRVCLNPAWEAAMGPAPSHGRCPRRGFRLGRGG